jgi:hypothetical protein
MYLFFHKINPFSSITINLGPLYLERLFDKLLIKQGHKEINKMSMADRFESHLEYLSKRIGRSSDLRYSSIQFYMGYFYQQLANYSMQIETARHCRERVLCHYQLYLNLSTCQYEGRYYAQWQSAVLQGDPNIRSSMPEFKTKLKGYSSTLTSNGPHIYITISSQSTNRISCETIVETIRRGPNGFSNPILISQDGYWKSKKLTSELNIGNRQIELALYEG